MFIVVVWLLNSHSHYPKPMSQNLSATVYTWLKELKIPVSKTYLKQQLLSHPDYPSLLSITDTLNELGIDNAAVQVEKEQLGEITTPFLAHLNVNGGEFTVVRNVEDPGIPDFFNRWGGVIIAAEKSNNWNHAANAESMHIDLKRSKALVVTLFILAFFVVFSGVISFDWLKTILLLIAAAGISVSWMVISKDMGIENKIADQVCGKEADCNTVIHSDAAKLPFGISWSDAGIIYFSFLLLSLILSSFNNPATGVYPVFSMLSIAALPFTIMSLYYQWRIIKKWCRLCLITVGLLWLKFIVLLPTTGQLINYGFDASIFYQASQMLFLFFAITAAWLWLKPLIKENKKIKSENFAAKRFSRNADVFNALLKKQKKLTVSPDGLGITIGNPAATTTIVKVCNPYCAPCAKAHPVIEKLLEQNGDLKVQILFNATDDEKDMRAKPVKHLMALYEKSGCQNIEQALDDWYAAEEKDYEVFAKKYELNGELERQGDKLKLMKSWYDQMKIEFTPTFFVNGYQLPDQYRIDDLKYFF